MNKQKKEQICSIASETLLANLNLVEEIHEYDHIFEYFSVCYDLCYHQRCFCQKAKRKHIQEITGYHKHLV